MQILVTFTLLSQCFAFLIPQKPLFETLDEPSSVSFCSSDQDIFIPQTFKITPDPPQRGQTLDIYLNGTLSETVDQGSIAKVKVKLGFIQLLDREFNLCEEVKQVGKECPLEKGNLEVRHQVDIPNEIPPGHYKLHVEAFNFDTRPITCLDGDFRIN